MDKIYIKLISISGFRRKAGIKIASIGARIWNKYDEVFNDDSSIDMEKLNDHYDDLNFKAKLGYKIMIFGFSILKLNNEDIRNLCNELKFN